MSRAPSGTSIQFLSRTGLVLMRRPEPKWPPSMAAVLLRQPPRVRVASRPTLSGPLAPGHGYVPKLTRDRIRDRDEYVRDLGADGAHGRAHGHDHDDGNN